MKCRLCGSENTVLKFPNSKINSRLNLMECRDCRFQFRNIPENEAYSFYDEGYYSGKSAFSYLDERCIEDASRIVWKKRIEYLKKYEKTNSPQKRFLEAGCSFGGLMQVANEAGFDSYGIEISEYSGNYAEKRFSKDKIYIGSCENVALPEDHFCAAAMIEVIEHIYNPLKALRNICSSLKKGGVLLVQTADMSGLQAVFYGANYHYYLDGHVSYFNRSNLSESLLSAGFSKLKFFGGVEFGLLPKLLKSRYGFKRKSDYLTWIRIIYYHVLSKISIFGVRLTSSMVILAWK